MLVLSPATLEDNMSDALLSPREAADMLGLKKMTLDCWRSNPASGPGLPFIRISGRCIRYRLSDIKQFLEDRTVRRGDPSA
jgi:predicted DNA-binding transcriptional regulator AlpA